jgi:hypothetical protein
MLKLISLFFLLFSALLSVAESHSPYRGRVNNQDTDLLLSNFYKKLSTKRTLTFSSSKLGRVKMRFTSLKDASTLPGRLLQGEASIRQGKIKRSFPASGVITKNGKGELIFRGNAVLSDRKGAPIYLALKKIVGKSGLRLIRAPKYALSGVKCAHHKLDRLTPKELTASFTANSPQRNVLRTMEIATEGDHLLYNIHVNDSNAHILGIMEAVNTMYQNSISLGIRVVNQRVTVNSSVYPSNVIDSEVLLLDFFKGRDLGESDANLLFTPRNMADGVVGIAFISGTCNPNFKYGVVQDINDAVTPIIAAHEMGHLLSANHDEPDGNPRQREVCTGPQGRSLGFIMTTALNSIIRPPTFSTCSQNSFNQFLLSTQSSCLKAVATPTPTPTPTPVSSGGGNSGGGNTGGGGSGGGEAPGGSIDTGGNVFSPDGVMTATLRRDLLSGTLTSFSSLQWCTVTFRAATKVDRIGNGILLGSTVVSGASSSVSFGGVSSHRVLVRSKKDLTRRVFIGAFTSCPGKVSRLVTSTATINPNRVPSRSTKPLSQWIRLLAKTFAVS